MRAATDAICFSANGIVTWGQFAADVATLRDHIDPATHVCNLLTDRYAFLVGVAAALLNGQVTVLPAAAAAQAVEAALAGAPRPLILGGKPEHHGAFDTLAEIPRSDQSIPPEDLVSSLEATATEIHVYTSGSTKTPERRIKDWRTLVGGAAVTEEILRRLNIAPGTTAILGTTPHQHMYGLEATVFLALGFGHCTHQAPIFYPADLDAAMADARANGFTQAVLITSPTHMKFLEPTLLEQRDICAVVSATAPLSHAQAERLEARGDLAVMEIYGSTETGSLAIRRTIEGNIWTPVAGFKLKETKDGAIASAPHLAETCLLGDAVELLPNRQFKLLGRTGDMIGIAGKRSNLSALNAILVETPGLRDGVVLHRQVDGEDQLAIVAVLGTANGLSKADGKSEIRKQFRAHIDAIFLPKRIVFTDSISRTPTGKITAETLADLHQLCGWN